MLHSSSIELAILFDFLLALNNHILHLVDRLEILGMPIYSKLSCAQVERIV